MVTSPLKTKSALKVDEKSLKGEEKPKLNTPKNLDTELKEQKQGRKSKESSAVVVEKPTLVSFKIINLYFYPIK